MKSRLPICLLIACLATVLCGCGQSETPPPPGLAGLSEEDRIAAMGHGDCPVCGAELGSKGAPVKVDLKGMTAFVCSASCEEPLKQDPDKYASKVTE